MSGKCDVARVKQWEWSNVNNKQLSDINKLNYKYFIRKKKVYYTTLEQLFNKKQLVVQTYTFYSLKLWKCLLETYHFFRIGVQHNVNQGWAFLSKLKNDRPHHSAHCPLPANDITVWQRKCETPANARRCAPHERSWWGKQVIEGPLPCSSLT